MTWHRFSLRTLLILVTICCVAARAERWRRSRTPEFLTTRLLEYIDAEDHDGALKVAERAAAIHPDQFGAIHRTLRISADIRRDGKYPPGFYRCVSFFQFD